MITAPERSASENAKTFYERRNRLLCLLQSGPEFSRLEILLSKLDIDGLRELLDDGERILAAAEFTR